MWALPVSVLVVLAASEVPPAESPPPPALLRELTFDFETGPAYVFQNDNRYGATGTAYTAADVGQQRNLFIARRLSLEAAFAERHRVILLYAPFDLTTRVTLDRAIDFNGILFNPGEVVDHRYLFDGYRASYLYGVVRAERLQWDVGASLQIRNASVELRSVDAAPARLAVENDIGVVVALKTRLTWRPARSWWATIEGDGISSFGIASVSGALYDVSLTAGAPVRPGADVFLRLRWLGGGADVPNREIENWGNFFFATAGARIDFTRLMLH